MSVQQEYFKSIADKIREKTNSSELIKPIAFAQKLDEVYEAGKNSEYDTFWDTFQDKGNRTNYEYGFSGIGWDDVSFQPKYPLMVSNGNYMFRGAKITKIPVIDFQNCETLSSTFSYARVLITIEKIILRNDGTNVFSSAFVYCDELQNIEFEGIIGTNIAFSKSPKLTTESINNIIEHLKDLMGELSQTITFHSLTGSKLTDAQRKDIQDKNWDLVY